MHYHSWESFLCLKNLLWTVDCTLRMYKIFFYCSPQHCCLAAFIIFWNLVMLCGPNLVHLCFYHISNIVVIYCTAYFSRVVKPHFHYWRIRWYCGKCMVVNDGIQISFVQLHISRQIDFVSVNNIMGCNFFIDWLACPLFTLEVLYNQFCPACEWAATFILYPGFLATKVVI